MSIRIMTHIWENPPQKGTNLLMLLALADMANDDGDCWPGIKHLARKTRMSDRNVQFILRKLVEDGELHIFENEGKMTSGGATNRYHLPIGVVKPISPGVVKPISPESSLEPSFETGEREQTPPQSENAIPNHMAAFENGLDAGKAGWLDVWRNAHVGHKPMALRGRARADALDQIEELIEMGVTPETLTTYIQARQRAKKSTDWRWLMADIHAYLNQLEAEESARAAQPGGAASADNTRVYDEASNTTMVWNPETQRYDLFEGNQV